MKITDRYQSLTDRVSAKPVARPEKTDGANGTQRAAQGSASDGFQVSGKAHELAAQSAAKVAELKASIANGSFNVDSAAIANALVGDD